MEISIIISALALIISVGGLIYAKKSFDLSKDTQEKTNEIAIDIEKNELLQLISNNKQLLNKASIELGALEADFEVESQPVRTIMSQQTEIFTSFLPTINYAIDNLENLHTKIHNWNGQLSHKDVMHYKAELYDQMKEHELTHETATSLANTFKEKLIEAKEYVNGVTR